MQHSSLQTASSAVTSPQDLANGAAARSSEEGIISQLRNIRATGRIVLEFKADSTGTDAIPNLPLENGDRFVVPSRPAHVNVLGAVYDQNSFLYNNQRTVGAYLHLAGGPNRTADAKHSFVIRANGEVISRDSTSGMWNNKFDDLHLNPGDTIVVPEKTFKPSGLRGVLEWSQLFSQLALGAASLSVIVP